jgi:uncharacterized RDD family membrane protein YckC
MPISSPRRTAGNGNPAPPGEPPRFSRAAHAFALALVPLFLTAAIILVGLLLLGFLSLIPARESTSGNPAEGDTSPLLRRLYPGHTPLTTPAPLPRN